MNHIRIRISGCRIGWLRKRWTLDRFEHAEDTELRMRGLDHSHASIWGKSIGPQHEPHDYRIGRVSVWPDNETAAILANLVECVEQHRRCECVTRLTCRASSRGAG